MRFTAIATLLMVAVTIGVTPALRMDLLRMLGGAVDPGVEAQGESQAGDTGQRLAEIPRQVLDTLPAASPEEAESEQRRVAVDLNALAPAAGPETDAAGEGAVQVAALPPVVDPLHDSEIYRLTDLAPAAPPSPAPPSDTLASLDPQALDPQALQPAGVALFVAIGSFDSLREAAVLVRRHADWDPMIHRAKMNQRMRHVVVLGPFESGDVGAVLKRLRETGIAEPWPLAVQLRPGLEVKGLELFG